MIILYSLIFVLIMMIGFLFLAPWITENNLVLVEVSGESANIVARGFDTLWYQWQSYIYIVLAILILAGLCGFIFSLARQHSDKNIKQQRQQITDIRLELIADKKSFRDRKTAEIKTNLEQEFAEITQVKNEVLEERQLASDTWYDVKNQTRLNEISNNHQQRRNRGAINQKRRALNKQNIIENYLDHAHFSVNGQTLTYQHLLQLSKEYARSLQDL